MAISEDMDVGAVAAEVATPVALLREDNSGTPLRETNPPSREEKQTHGRGPPGRTGSEGRHWK
jgi:hypothetical protein